jgi:hypothetical protein
MRNKIENWIIENAPTVCGGLVFGIFSALAILSVCGLIYGLLILGGYV